MCDFLKNERMPKVENHNTRLRAGKVTRLVLNFLIDPSSHRKIVGLVDKYTGKPFRLENISLVNMHKVIADGSEAPEESRKHRLFPVEFWFIVKGTQGQGRFVRPKSQIYNRLLP